MSYRQHAAIGLLFALFAVVELWTPIAHGGYFSPTDIGQLWAVTRTAAGPPSPKNALQSDVYVDFDPFLHYDVAQVTSGHFPSWNPYNGNGQPFFADDQTIVLSPFTLPFYVLGFKLALIAAALARLWLLGFFTYLFLARHRIRVEAAAIGGALFAYAGYHLVWLNYQTIVSVSATLPIALWSLRVALDHPTHTGSTDGLDSARRKKDQTVRTIALVGLAITLAVMIYDGHPETAVFDSLLVAGYAVLALCLEFPNWRTRLAWIARLCGVAGLAVGLAAFQLIPFVQYTAEGARPASLSADPAASVAGFLPDTVPLMAFPDLFGGPQFTYNDPAFFARHKPQNNFAEVEGNAVGLLALCLLPLGLFAFWRRRRSTIAWFGASAAVVGTWVLYTRVAGLWWHHVPLLGRAGLNRSQDIQLIGIAVLAALGVDWVLEHDVAARSSRKALTVLIGSVSVVGVLLFIGASNLRTLIGRLPRSTAHMANALNMVRDNIVVEVSLAAAFVVALAVVLLSTRSIVRWASVVVAIGLAFASNGLVMRSYNPTVPASEFYPHTPAVLAVTKQISNGETLFTGQSFPFASTNLWFGLHDIGSYDAIGFKWHDALYEKAFAVRSPSVERMPACRNVLRLFGVQWVVGGNGMWHSSRGGGLRASTTIRGVPVYRVPESSLVSLVGSAVESTGGDQRALAAATNCAFNPNRTVILDASSFDASARGTLGETIGTSAAAGTAHIDGQSATQIIVGTSSARRGWLVIRQSYAPGWTARVDGRSVPLMRADVAFQAVEVPAGTHRVVLEYQPHSLSIGFVISLVSVLGTLVALSLAAILRRTGRLRRPTWTRLRPPPGARHARSVV